MQDKPTLMLVDDEPNILSALKRLLRPDGYTILAYEDARQALADMDGRPVDVILTDQRMPNMSGVEFLRRARQSHPDTIRIVLSGYTELQFVTDAINEGAVYKFLTKPWDDEQLREHIREAFRSKGIADENRHLTEALRAANTQLQAHAQELERQAGQLENTLDILQEVLQLIPWPILGVDDDGMIALANAASEALLGQQGMPLMGQNLSESLGDEARAWLGQAGETPQAVELAGQRFNVVRRPMGRKSRSRGHLIALMPLEARS
ncbi:MAG TPA: response regulator [Thiobacillaceae bacterium]|nr:response regulator [Thiobacillaceae bacterium]